MAKPTRRAVLAALAGGAGMLGAGYAAPELSPVFLPRSPGRVRVRPIVLIARRAGE